VPDHAARGADSARSPRELEQLEDKLDTLHELRIDAETMAVRLS
jgi:hypothetical protein